MPRRPRIPRPDRTSAGGSFRTLFLSDLHLGKPLCQAEALLAFLRCHQAQTIYLVGDIIDFEYLQRRPEAWSPAHDAVVAHVLACAEAGTQVIYLPGNHDEVLRASRNLRLGPIRVRDRVAHACLDGRKLLVIHGDQYDIVLRLAGWLGPLGDRLYDMTLILGVRLNALLGHRNGPSPSAAAKWVVKLVIQWLGRFDAKVSADLRAGRFDGIVCGHLHRAAERDLQGFAYFNAGDWMESCTAVVERHDGVLEVLRWDPAAPTP